MKLKTYSKYFCWKHTQVRRHWKIKSSGWVLGHKPSLTVLAPFSSCHNHADGNGNSIHSVKIFAYWNSMQILEWGPRLRSLAFPTLFSEFLSHLWSIPHSLLLSHAALYGLDSQADWKCICNRDHHCIYHVSPTMHSTEVAMLACIYSSIYSALCLEGLLCARIQFYVYPEDMDCT